MFNFRHPTSSEKKIRIRVALVVKSLKLLRRCGDFDLALNESTVRRLISELEKLNPEYSAEMTREGQDLAKDLANELQYQLYGYNYKLVEKKRRPRQNRRSSRISTDRLTKILVGATEVWQKIDGFFVWYSSPTGP